jgi:hypothetical protein
MARERVASMRAFTKRPNASQLVGGLVAAWSA